MKQEQIFDLLYENKLTWEVLKLPLVAELDSEILLTNSFGTFRSDTKEQLGTVGEKYHVFQNQELAKTILEAAEGLKLEVTKGGELQNGRKVFLQIQLNQEEIGNSKMNRWITALNSHDGSTSIGFGSTNTVVVCQNTFYKAFRDLTKIRHTMTAQERVNTAMEELKLAITNDEQLVKTFKNLSEVKLEDEILAKIVNNIFKVDMAVTNSKDVSTRKINQMKSISSSIAKDIEIHGDNLWALFNGVTRYTNHCMVKDSKKEENIMTGTGSKINISTFNLLESFVNSNTADLLLV